MSREPGSFVDSIAGRGAIKATAPDGSHAGHLRYDEDGIFSEHVEPEHQHVEDHLKKKMRSLLKGDPFLKFDPKTASQMTAPDDLTISREYYPSGGSKYGHRYTLSAKDADGEEQGWLRYHEPKRKGSPIHVEEVRGHAPGVASHLLNHMESLHPEASRTEFLGEKNRRNKNTPGHHDGEHGKPTDWDQHYDALGEIHRGFSVRLDPRDARTVVSPDHPAAEHVKVLQDKVAESNAGIHWTAGLQEAKNFAGKHQYDPRTDVPVILHAQKPARKDIETRPNELFRNGVFPHDHLEKEVPVRRGRDVQLTGISWKPDTPHPEADEDGWLHHTFAEPITKRAVEEYRMQHRAPGPDDTPMHEMPEDAVTHPEYYGSGRVGRPSNYHCNVEHAWAKRSWDNASAASKVVGGALGKPEHKVDIYRAVPKHVDKIHTGDWVTLHPGYAQSHGESNMSGDYKILKASVPAKHVNWDWGSLDEFGYNGPHTSGTEHTGRQPALPEHDEDGTAHVGRVAARSNVATVEDDPARWGSDGWRAHEMKRSTLRETHRSGEYTYHHAPGPLNDDDEGYGNIYVTHGDDPHNVVGESYYGPHPGRQGHLELASRVAPEHRRKGVATGMYDFAERLTGKPTAPADVNSEQAQGFWRNRLKENQ